VGLDSGVAWTVYLARCGDGTLYTGISTDAVRRVAEHNAGAGAAYTRSRLPIVLVYSEAVPDRRTALRREYAIKQLSRAEKEALAQAESEGLRPG
jgi:putative endonuclease